MKILVCSDGTAASVNAIQLASLFAAPMGAETTLLGIAETAADEQPLRETLGSQAAALTTAGLSPKLVVVTGEPTRQIIAETTAHKYDLVVIGARRKNQEGIWGHSERTYEVIKAIEPPVLVAVGKCEKLKRFLVCTGGKNYIDNAVRLAGDMAKTVGAEVTIMHVMAEPPAIYADLVRLEEDVDGLLASGSELGRTLGTQKKQLEKMGVTTTVRVRHGIVLEQVFAEVAEGDYDLVVSGSSRARGPLRHYIMGNLTRGILNRAERPVLVARSDAVVSAGFLGRLRGIFSKKERVG